jgi:hypothetical protein
MSPEQVAREMNLTKDVQRRYMDVLSGRMDFQQLPALESARYDSFRNKVRAGGRQLREGEGHFGDSKEKQKEDDSQSEFEKRYSNREIEY